MIRQSKCGTSRRTPAASPIAAMSSTSPSLSAQPPLSPGPGPVPYGSWTCRPQQGLLTSPHSRRQRDARAGGAVFWQESVVLRIHGAGADGRRSDDDRRGGGTGTTARPGVRTVRPWPIIVATVSLCSLALASQLKPLGTETAPILSSCAHVLKHLCNR